MQQRESNSIRKSKTFLMIPLPFSLLVIAEILYSITRIESTSEALDNAMIPYRFNDIIINQYELRKSKQKESTKTDYMILL